MTAQIIVYNAAVFRTLSIKESRTQLLRNDLLEITSTFYSLLASQMQCLVAGCKQTSNVIW